MIVLVKFFLRIFAVNVLKKKKNLLRAKENLIN